MWQRSVKEVASQYTDLCAQLLATATPHLALREHRQSWLGAVRKGHVDKANTGQYVLYSLLSENSWWFCRVSDGRGLIGLSSASLEWVKPMKKEWQWWQADSWKSRWMATGNIQKLRLLLSSLAMLLITSFHNLVFCLLCFSWTSHLKPIPEAFLPSVQIDTLWLQSRYLQFVICVPVIYSTKKLSFRNFSCRKKWLPAALENLMEIS